MGLGKGCTPLLSYYPIGQYDCFALKRQKVSRKVGLVVLSCLYLLQHISPPLFTLTWLQLHLELKFSKGQRTYWSLRPSN